MKISLEARSKVATYPSLFSHRGKVKKCEEKYNCVGKNKNVSMKSDKVHFNDLQYYKLQLLLVLCLYYFCPEDEVLSSFFFST